LNRSQLVKAVAAHTGHDVKAVDATLRGFTEVVTAVTSKGEAVAISGFAKFARVERQARMGRNPATGAPVRIKASKRARITPLKAFKDAVLTPSLAPKLAKGVWPAEAAPVKAVAKKAPAAVKAAVKRAPAAKKAPAVRKAPAATARKAPAAKKR
jgi:DNA-binding protein HU-beta